MTIRRTLLAAAIAAGLAGAATAAVAVPSPAAAAEGCTYNNPKTVATVHVRSRGIELRANNMLPGNTNQCAWGRIFGSPGDRVWVDRREIGASNWVQLGVTTINSGGGNHTPAFNDHRRQMRACGHAAGFSWEVACTIWW